MLKAYLHPKKKPNERHWYAYDVVFDGEIIVTNSRDPFGKTDWPLPKPAINTSKNYVALL
jgi:hypothetical protein